MYYKGTATLATRRRTPEATHGYNTTLVKDVIIMEVSRCPEVAAVEATPACNVKI